MDAFEDEIKKLALQNALEHNGKTQTKIVLAKLLGSYPQYRTKVKEILQEISKIVQQVSDMSVSQQREEVEKHFSDLLIPKEKEATQASLPPLEDAKKGQVITRFPPEPNGYPHIGHAKAAIINEEYVNLYGGKKILRMDDTNPENERLEYYAAIKVGLEWLGIEYDVIKNTSDDMEVLYQKGFELITKNKAYVCTCKRDDISKNRRQKKPCKCSMLEPESNSERWHKLFDSYKEGQAIVRYRGDMSSDNTVMRDPVLFRIIEQRHPLHGDKYRVWPSYDFAVAIEDSLDGVTHAFRSKEYELRNELYYSILDDLAMRKPKVLEFSRLEFEGMPVSKRILKPLIEEQKVSWYDDPRLPTLEGLKRRGILPSAIRRFILSLGFTKSDTLAPFDSLEAFNRKIIDPTSIRLFMVIEPTSLRVTGLDKDTVELPNYPSKESSKRTLKIDGNFFLSRDDVALLKEGDTVRLIGVGNIKITNKGSSIGATYVGDEMSNVPKLQWVPQNAFHEIKILVPKPLFIGDTFNEDSLQELYANTESHYLNLEDGCEIQFVRFGYCRKDSQNQAIFTHK